MKVAEDQSQLADFQNSDFIAAEEQAVAYANPTLRFTHRTALVHIALTGYTAEQMFVQLRGLSTADGNPPNIAPQTVAQGTAFIACAFTNGKSFVYRMQKDAEWKAGEEYTYTVSLAAAEDPATP